MKTELDVFIKGLFYNNPVFVQILGLTPLLVFSVSFISGLICGLCTFVVLLVTSCFVSGLRRYIPRGSRIFVFTAISAGIALAACITACALVPSAADSLIWFLPFAGVNTLYSVRSEEFYARNGILPSVSDAVGCGAGFCIVILVVSSLREILGAGTFAGIRIVSEARTVPLFISPAGGLLIVGLLCGLFNYIRTKTGGKAK